MRRFFGYQVFAEKIEVNSLSLIMPFGGRDVARMAKGIHSQDDRVRRVSHGHRRRVWGVVFHSRLSVIQVILGLKQFDGGE